MMTTPRFSPNIEMAVTPAMRARSVSAQRHEGFFHRCGVVRRFTSTAEKRIPARFDLIDYRCDTSSVAFPRRNPSIPAIQTP
jgi:hypothetical protein